MASSHPIESERNAATRFHIQQLNMQWYSALEGFDGKDNHKGQIRLSGRHS
jgi:hypothetical protein